MQLLPGLHCAKKHYLQAYVLGSHALRINAAAGAGCGCYMAANGYLSARYTGGAVIRLTTLNL